MPLLPSLFIFQVQVPWVRYKICEVFLDWNKKKILSWFYIQKKNRRKNTCTWRTINLHCLRLAQKGEKLKHFLESTQIMIFFYYIYAGVLLFFVVSREEISQTSRSSFCARWMFYNLEYYMPEPLVWWVNCKLMINIVLYETIKK